MWERREVDARSQRIAAPIADRVEAPKRDEVLEPCRQLDQKQRERMLSVDPVIGPVVRHIRVNSEPQSRWKGSGIRPCARG